MFDQIDPALLPYIDSELRQLLQAGVLPVEDNQAHLDEAKKKHEFIEASIPKPTREDLIRRVHGEYQDMLRAGRLESRLEKTLLDDAERGWYEGLRAEAIRKAKESGWRDLSPPATTQPPKPRRLAQNAPKSDLASSLEKQANSLSEKLRELGTNVANPPKKKPKPDPQLQAHEAALLRQQQEQQRKYEKQRGKPIGRPDYGAPMSRLTLRALDLRRKLEEEYGDNPEKAAFLPAANAPVQDLHKWYEEMSKPEQLRESGIEGLRDEVDRASKVMGEATELLLRKTPKPPSDGPPHTEPKDSSRHPVLAAVFAVLGTLILNELHVPLKLTLPLWIVLGLCIWQWPWIVKTKRRLLAFWVSLAVYVSTIAVVMVVPLVQRAGQPTGNVRIVGSETETARIKTWGTSGEHDVFAVVNTIELSPLADDYRLLIVCRAQDNKIDSKDDIRIDKSALFSISGADQRIEVALSQDTMRRIIPDGWVNIYILLVPTKVNVKDLRSVNELTSNGAYVIGNPSLFVHAIIENKSGRLVGG